VPLDATLVWSGGSLTSNAAIVPPSDNGCGFRHDIARQVRSHTRAFFIKLRIGPNSRRRAKPQKDCSVYSLYTALEHGEL
jgi:hypothetical protein